MTMLFLDPGLLGGCVVITGGFSKTVFPEVTATKGGPVVNVKFKKSGSDSIGFALLPNMQVGDQITVGLPATDTLSFEAFKGGCPFSSSVAPTNMPAGSDITPTMLDDQTADGNVYTVQTAGDFIVKYTVIGTPDPNYQITLQVQ
ncbi:hypothetical protein EHQ53_17690 [Leptospira langatensis]|uniref:Uncharacterized protein n=1 Tax=Leptospira langatensis TaxID=2484983 RepID=A0A5F1ZRD4_9LEPT|nr:hypothetical protein [Leptospira langatensis]TGK05464.1 hypothetical protein EHO57_01930 [Leptospira langatensis]TGL38600.1 hypothetical protein EHQ53_17690 [Leptospira langatensis]